MDSAESYLDVEASEVRMRDPYRMQQTVYVCAEYRSITDMPSLEEIQADDLCERAIE